MKDYKLKQRNLRASHTLGYKLVGLFLSLYFFPPAQSKKMKNNSRDEQEPCGLHTKKQRVEGKEGADAGKSTEIGGLSEGQ